MLIITLFFFFSFLPIEGFNSISSHKSTHSYEEALKDQLNESPKDSLLVANSHNELGIAYANNCDYEKALTHFTETKRIRRKKLGETLLVASSCNNLGLVHYNMANYREAWKLHGEAFDIQANEYGKSSNQSDTKIEEIKADMFRSKHYLGLIWIEKDKLENALIILKKCLKFFEKSKKYHSDKINLYNNLGIVCIKISIVCSEISVFCPKKGIFYKTEGIAYKKDGQEIVYTKEDLIKDAIDYFNKSFKEGGKTPLDSICMNNNLGIVYAEKEEYEEAIKYHNESLAISMENGGEDCLDVSRAYNNLGLIHFYNLNYKVSFVYYDKSLAISEKLLGYNHPEVAITYKNKGDLFCEQNNYKDSTLFYQKAEDIYTNNFENEKDKFELLKRKLRYVKFKKKEKEKETLKEKKIE